jgi:hypothetical protein
MRYVVLCFALVALFCAFPGAVFAYNVCADVNEDGSLDVSDVVYMLDAYDFGAPLPDGKGDIDYRQNHNIGDFRYLTNYIFVGGGEGSCPPFSSYDILPTDDTIILPEGEIPAGSGTIGYPITLVNHDSIYDLMLPIVVDAPGVSITEVTFEFSGLQQIAVVSNVSTLEKLLITADLVPSLCIQPGIHTLGVLEITYESSPGATFTVDTTSFDDKRFLHYTYGEPLAEAIGTPTIITVDQSPYPTMSVEPDSLFFSTLTDIPIAEPDTFTVISSGDPYAWTLTHTDWLEVTPTAGMSGQKVAVRPIISGLSVGFHYGTITVSADGTIGSPQEVIVELELKQTYPSFDANCDGQFDVDDIVVLVMYVFGGGDPPCDPCAAK